MPKLTIALWLLYLMISLGVRLIIQVRMTGSSGSVLHRRRASPLQMFASVLFVSSLFAGLASPILAATYPEASFWSAWPVPSAMTMLGGVGWLCGVTLAFTSQVTLGCSWRIGVDATERTELVTRGMFGVARNPVFSALFLTAVSLALLCATPLAWIACVVQAIALEIQVRLVEEPHLARVHGEAYRAYTSRVGRFIPGVGLSGPQPSTTGPQLND
ncbi:MAG TPA: isoprenylcysteine carboxylmethyltransferase family protein [Polyangiales bacterium]|nr:isoprenylcysteine carboxylmethyltransferase family protein [Polyangiales bacterium]